MNPARFSQMMKYLTRAKKANPELPDVTFANKISQPPVRQDVEEIEAINRFMRANPRTEKAGGGRIGFKKGERADLALENITRAENAKRLGVKTRDAPFFKALPDYDNITYTDFRNKETGEVFRKYNVRVRVRDKNKTKTATTADKYKNIDSLDEALKLRDDFRKANPKNIKPLDPEKAKITKGARRDFIKAQEGDEAFLRAKKGESFQKGHAGNIENPDLKIKPKDVIYTPTEVNEGMAAKLGAKGTKETFSALDFKIRAAENEIEKIKKSNISPKEKKRLLDIQDKLLTDYHFQSGGFKTPTLSTGEVFGESTRKGMSMDQMDLFPDMTEKETKKFVRKYIGEKGTLKPFYQRLVDSGEISEIDKENIRKSKLFLDNVDLAKQNVKNFDVPAMKRLAAIGCPGKMMGGRVGFSKGENLQACALKGVEKLKGDPGKLTGGDQANLRAISKSAKAARLLKNVLGPAAIAGEVLIEGGIAANKFMSEGVPIKQALGQSYLNYLLGPKTKIDVEAERAKEFAKGEDFAMAERGRRMAPFMAQSKEADAQRLRKREQQMEQAFPTTSPQEIDEILKTQGMTIQDFGMTYPQIQDFIKQDQQMQAIADAGGVANLAGGGIAKEAGDPSGRPPESGPQPQGLLSLKNRARNY